MIEPTEQRIQSAKLLTTRLSRQGNYMTRISRLSAQVVIAIAVLLVLAIVFSVIR